VVLLPVGISASTSSEDKLKIAAAIEDLRKQLASAGVRVHVDDRDNYSIGWKYNHWELKGSFLHHRINM
jgi:hypothetical protein